MTFRQFEAFAAVAPQEYHEGRAGIAHQPAVDVEAPKEPRGGLQAAAFQTQRKGS